MRRRQDIELLRILGCFGVVWIHARAGDYQAASAGLVVFLMLSISLSGQAGGADWPTLRRRGARLLVPWLIWFVIYASVNALSGKPIIAMEHGLAAGIMAGPSIHLWYVPFIFICLVTLDLVRNRAPGLLLSMTCGTLATAVIASTSLWRYPSLEMGYPLAQWTFSLAAVLFGAFLLYSNHAPTPARIILVFSFLICAYWMIPYRNIGLPYFLGSIASVVVTSKKFANFLPFDITYLSQNTFGIYLSHMLFVNLLVKVSTIRGPLLPITAFLASAVFVLSLRKALPRLARYWL